MISAAFLVPTEIRSALRHRCHHALSRCHSQVVQELFAHRRSGAKSMVSSNGSVQKLSFHGLTWFKHTEPRPFPCSDLLRLADQWRHTKDRPSATDVYSHAMQHCTEEGGIRPTLHIDVHGCRDPLEPPEITPGQDDVNGCFWVCHGLSWWKVAHFFQP